MEIQNCKNCKRLFNYITGERLCPKCRDEIEDKFVVVKSYIEDNPGANINVVAEECETSVRQIKQWVREERLAFTEDSLVGLECERCGKMIHSGRFCEECAGNLTNAMNDLYRTKKVAKTPKGSAAGKMRFLE